MSWQIVGWRGTKTVRCLVGKYERMHYKLLLGAPPEVAEVDGIKRTHREEITSNSIKAEIFSSASQEQGLDDGHVAKRARQEKEEDTNDVGFWSRLKGFFGF